MSILRTDELDAMRETADSALPDTCTISRAARTADGAGGWSTVWAQTGGTYACRLASANIGSSSAEREQADRDTSSTDWVVTLPHGTDVTAADRIVTGGRTFEVVTVEAPMSWEISRRVRVVEVT